MITFNEYIIIFTCINHTKAGRIINLLYYTLFYVANPIGKFCSNKSCKYIILLTTVFCILKIYFIYKNIYKITLIEKYPFDRFFSDDTSIVRKKLIKRCFLSFYIFSFF